MSTDELASREGLSSSMPESLGGSAEDDRRLAAEDRRQAASYLSAAYRDETTGALNRRPGREQMQALADRAHRDSSVLTFVFVDVDGLKRVNDSQGHERGDALLAAVGTALRASLRSYDLVVRYGGDEFVCALPGGTADVAEESLARVRSALDELLPGATVSAGYAELRPTDSIDDAIHRADTDLFVNRRRGGAAAGSRLSMVAPPSHGEQRPSVACGMCGDRVGLSEFVFDLTPRMTRSADCPGCGATTVIQLARASSQPAALDGVDRGAPPGRPVLD